MIKKKQHNYCTNNAFLKGWTESRKQAGSGQGLSVYRMNLYNKIGKK